MVKLHFYSDGQKFQEADISLGTDDNVDFYSAMDVEKYVGKTIEIAGEIPAGAGEKIHCQDKRPATEYAFRPQIHFAAETGWINDPNERRIPPLPPVEPLWNRMGEYALGPRSEPGYDNLGA